MEEETVRVLCYFSFDDRVYVYNFTWAELNETVEIHPEVDRIYFLVSDEELATFFHIDEQKDNLKRDFIWFQPGVNKRHIMQCTCGKFLKSGHDMDKLAKQAVKHSLKTGHMLNPRGN